MQSYWALDHLQLYSWKKIRQNQYACWSLNLHFFGFVLFFVPKLFYLLCIDRNEITQMSMSMWMWKWTCIENLHLKLGDCDINAREQSFININNNNSWSNWGVWRKSLSLFIFVFEGSILILVSLFFAYTQIFCFFFYSDHSLYLNGSLSPINPLKQLYENYTKKKRKEFEPSKEMVEMVKILPYSNRNMTK